MVDSTITLRRGPDYIGPYLFEGHRIVEPASLDIACLGLELLGLAKAGKILWARLLEIYLEQGLLEPDSGVE